MIDDSSFLNSTIEPNFDFFTRASNKTVNQSINQQDNNRQLPKDPLLSFNRVLGELSAASMCVDIDLVLTCLQRTTTELEHNSGGVRGIYCHTPRRFLLSCLSFAGSGWLSLLSPFSPQCSSKIPSRSSAPSLLANLRVCTRFLPIGGSLPGPRVSPGKCRPGTRQFIGEKERALAGCARRLCLVYAGGRLFQLVWDTRSSIRLVQHVDAGIKGGVFLDVIFGGNGW